jgi:hyperosmotically inducible protein
MNINVSSKPSASMQGRLFLDAMILAGLAAVLGLGLSDANAAAAEAASSGPTATQKTERVVSDTWITTKVKSEILKSSLAKGFDVKVTTLHGIVTLKGSLTSADVIDQVKAIAAKVKGVQSVDTSNLVVAAK